MPVARPDALQAAAAWVVAGQGEDSKGNQLICLQLPALRSTSNTITVSIKYDLPLHLLANSLFDSSSPIKQQLLTYLHVPSLGP